MRTNNIADNLYNQLLQAILNGEYEVGQRLPSETKLQAMYGVSRNTVRAVLGRLNAIGILETRHGSGTYVKRLEEYSYLDQIIPTTLSASSNLIDILELRKAIDVSCAYSAAINATPEDILQLEKCHRQLISYTGREAESYADTTIDFHVRVAYASHNNILIQLMELIKHIATSQMVDFLFNCGIDPESDFYHSMVLHCIKARHPEEASYMMEQHMTKLLERVRVYVRNMGGYIENKVDPKSILMKGLKENE